MLAAANCDDDFELVAVLQFYLSVLAARHDFAVAFNRNAFAGQAHLLQQLYQIEVRFKVLRCAVYRKGDHSGLLRKQR